VFWLLKAQEVLIKGNELSEYWRTFHLGNTCTCCNDREINMAESLSCQNTEVEDGKVLLYWRVETEGDGVIVLFSSSG
jgi:hypothetical protein